MATQKYEKLIKDICKMDKPTANPQSGLMRWQTKRVNNSAISDSFHDSSVTNRSQINTPGKNSIGKKSPGKVNTPNYSDRFIPSYNNSSFANYKMNCKDEDQENNLSPGTKERQEIMDDNLNPMANKKVIHISAPAMRLPNNSTKAIFTSDCKLSTTKRATRHIPSQPERVLDAPEFINDYYLNLLDWSANNIIAVALNQMVYMWSLESGNITELMDVDNNDSSSYVCSLSFTENGDFVAVGTSQNNVQIWDVENKKKVRTMSVHRDRVSSLSWNNHILSSGCRSGEIHHYDVRNQKFHIATLDAHTLEVCSLKWSSDGKYLASGGNDNLLNVWAANTIEPEEIGTVYKTPLHSFSDHSAAVKGLAFCPWQPSLLASGGGSLDKHIRFWNCTTGQCVSSINTDSQVCSLLWSTNYKELISSHGYDDHQLTIWKYPEMTKVKDLKGHSARALHLAMSPDGCYVASMSGDETLCLWKCFDKDARKVASSKTSSASANSSSTSSSHVASRHISSIR